MIRRKEWKKKRRKKHRKDEKERCVNENISFCYQGVVRKNTFSRNFTYLVEGEELSNSIEKYSETRSNYW